MKTTLKIIITVFLSLSQISVYAAESVTFEELPVNTSPLLQKINVNGLSESDANMIEALGLTQSYVCNVENEQYCVGRGDSSYSLPVRLSGEHMSGADCIWTGNNYYVRNSELDGFWYDASKYATTLRLYDKDWNKIKEYKLKNTYQQHPIKIGYIDGIYYCMLKEQWISGQLKSEKTIRSTDFENWEETDEGIPQLFPQVLLKDNMVSLNGNDFIPIEYEDKIDKKIYYTLGQWIVYIDNYNNIYFSNDNIYFVKANYPEKLFNSDINNNYQYTIKSVYEYNDNIVLDMSRRRRDSISEIGVLRLKIDKNNIYKELYKLQKTPIIQYKDKILAFSGIPVTENDYTLVPIRFLFEQMGADVSWNQDTQTAMVIKDSTVISFCIDNTDACVNGNSVSMNVPARLINGKTMVPIRFLSEKLGYTVNWNSDNRLITIE